MEFFLVPIEPGIVYNSFINFLNNLALIRYNTLRSAFTVSDAVLYDLKLLLRVFLKILNTIKTPGNPFEGEEDTIVFLTILDLGTFQRLYWKRPNKATLIFYYNRLRKNFFSRYCERLFTKIVSMFYKKKSLVMYYCILEEKNKSYNTKANPCENDIFRFVFESFEFYRSDPASFEFYYSPRRLLELPDGFDIYCIRNVDFLFHELHNYNIIIYINYSFKRMMASFMKYTLNVYIDESFGKMEPVILEDRIKYITLNVTPHPQLIEQANEAGYEFNIDASRMLDPLYTWEIKYFPYLWGLIYGFQCFDRTMNESHIKEIFMVDRLIQTYFYILMEISIFWFKGLMLAIKRVIPDYYISDRLNKIKLDLCRLVSFDTSANFGDINHFFFFLFGMSELKLKELIKIYKSFFIYKELNAFISKKELTLSFLFFEEKQILKKIKEKLLLKKIEKVIQRIKKKLSSKKENNDGVLFNVNNITNNTERFLLQQIEFIINQGENYFQMHDTN